MISMFTVTAEGVDEEKTKKTESDLVVITSTPELQLHFKSLKSDKQITVT